MPDHECVHGGHGTEARRLPPWCGRARRLHLRAVLAPGARVARRWPPSEVAGRLARGATTWPWSGWAAWHRTTRRRRRGRRRSRVRPLPLPRPVLYDAWLGLRQPPVQLATGRVDVIHATTIVVPPRTAPLAVTVHDLAFLHEPEHFTRARRARSSGAASTSCAGDADLVLCSSLATMADAEAAGIARGPAPPRAARCRPVGAAAERGGRAAASASSAPTSCSSAPSSPARTSPAWSRRSARLPDRPRSSPSPARRGGATAAPPAGGPRAGCWASSPTPSAGALYAGADAFVYPSLREGFGLPVARGDGPGHAGGDVAGHVHRGGGRRRRRAGGSATTSTTIADGIDDALAERRAARRRRPPAGRPS